MTAAEHPRPLKKHLGKVAEVNLALNAPARVPVGTVVVAFATVIGGWRPPGSGSGRTRQ